MPDLPTITPLQIRLAKAALGMSNPQVSRETGIHSNTINSAERPGGRANKSTLNNLRMFFESRGVVFVPENGGPAGVRYEEKFKD
jgi:hypothetical protein